MYLDSVFWFLSWPILIIVSFQIIKVILKRYEEEKVPKENE